VCYLIILNRRIIESVVPPDTWRGGTLQDDVMGCVQGYEPITNAIVLVGEHVV